MTGCFEGGQARVDHGLTVVRWRRAATEHVLSRAAGQAGPSSNMTCQFAAFTARFQRNSHVYEY
jgi:hypothetical protein